MNLQVQSQKPDQDGRTLEITPENAGWGYVGFEVYKLDRGMTTTKETFNREVCVVILSGKANVRSKHEAFLNIGERMSVFEWTPPYSVYIPSDEEYSIEALTPLEVAICSAPCQGNHDVRLIQPSDVGKETRGSGAVTRHIHNILPEDKPADHLLVVEVLTPGGNWSGFPPHKHDENNLPTESYLEETYYHKINPEQGFGYQRVYTKDRTIDENMCIRHDDAVLVPKGYHPVASPPGYDVYFLNVMAGPVRTWRFTNDPDHEWFLEHKKVY
ncbi:5-deoxy-glucuronate isomerase [Bacillaceae bacterium SIJ1]|uniref:5-deoxy-glucuronate isomerase n=1 Tax=Litoribacterium kuwaitense TaxID=1398745 RepID=UPI0013EBD05F|nr:5-deoxy-glucuronate isomerase [Litoribacterium kuwaitense]NGP43818.1 5-deoxy-glucuronate isomerase [Litoribacterium kuwaitense]